MHFLQHQSPTITTFNYHVHLFTISYVHYFNSQSFTTFFKRTFVCLMVSMSYKDNSFISKINPTKNTKYAK